MSTGGRRKRQRVRDFHRRARCAPEDVRRLGAGQYLTIHPLADEAELLKRLGIQPADCTSADAYWFTGRDVVLLSVSSREPGAVARRNPQAIWQQDRFFIVVEVEDRPLTTPTFESVMQRLLQGGIPGHRFCRGRTLRRLRIRAVVVGSE